MVIGCSLTGAKKKTSHIASILPVEACEANRYCQSTFWHAFHMQNNNEFHRIAFFWVGLILFKFHICLNSKWNIVSSIVSVHWKWLPNQNLNMNKIVYWFEFMIRRVGVIDIFTVARGFGLSRLLWFDSSPFFARWMTNWQYRWNVAVANVRFKCSCSCEAKQRNDWTYRHLRYS